MMFSATLSKATMDVCEKFMKKPKKIEINDQSKLTLVGLLQYYCAVLEKEKTRTLVSLLSKLQYNQTMIFCSTIQRAKHLNDILNQLELESITIHRNMSQEERLKKYNEFKQCQKRIMIATDVLARGIDIEKVNVVINYDMPRESDTYLHRVGRAGRFDTKGLAISFVTGEADTEVLKEIQGRFVIQMTELPDKIDQKLYCNN